jgi:4-hydroxybenzoyl-CoA thioesterase
MYINTRTVEIEWGACDPAGIVFNPRYFEYFDWSTVLLLTTALGISKAEMLKLYDCAGIPLVDSRARFLRPARYGDKVQIESQITEFGRSSFKVSHRLSLDGRLGVEGFETRVWTAPDPDHPGQMKSSPVPPPVIEALSR